MSRYLEAVLVGLLIAVVGVLLWVTPSDDVQHDAVYAPVEVSR